MRPSPSWVILFVAGATELSGISNPAAGQAAPRPVSFMREVRPILSRHCFACHGPDDAQRKGGLRLDTRAGAFAERDGTTAIVPGKPDESEVFLRVASDDPGERMPPAKNHEKLPPEQVELIRRWIAEGARWESHWAFEKPVRPPLPAVRDQTWPRNPIDRFILARLESEGLHPAPEADRYTLLRRVCLDLTGLPPTPEQVESFVTNQAPDAYDTLVDRLLQSSAYGERWARVWLDLARYADTKGYEKDLRRSIWRYRDWVIEALNADMPYDRFTTEQLAGDLLPNPTPDQVLATAFHRNTLVNDEGGTDDEEFRVAAVKDRVDTTMQVWMGLTFGCAKCHSHKYDPISQAEYYRLYAFFDQTEDSDKADDRPTLAIPNREQQAKVDSLHAEIEAREAALREPTAGQRQALERFAAEHRDRQGWAIVRPEQMVAASRSSLTMQPDGSILVSGPAPTLETYTLTIHPPALGAIRAIRLEAIPDRSLPKRGSGRAVNDGNFVLSGISLAVRERSGAERPIPLGKAEADFSQHGFPVAHAVANPAPSQHGWAVAPDVTRAHTAVFHLNDAANVADDQRLVIELSHQYAGNDPGFSLGRFRVSVTTDPTPTLEPDLPQTVATIVKRTAQDWTPDEVRQLWRYYSERAPELAPAREAIGRLRVESEAILNTARTPIMRELPADRRRDTRIHQRGNFLDPGESVTAASPASFGTFPADAPRNRLGLARWLNSPDNPLTARVAVNRHWAQFFGRGLVETQEDFGSQGQPPSHPELLDWLALEFREQQYSLKRLARLIVMSATYRQSARAETTMIEHDRFNRLLGRGARFRMDAEMIRDTTLATAGLLNRTLYGPSVMPYQPSGIWKSTYSLDAWVTSPGAERHRRGLYTFLKRTSPYPAMTTLDGPSREFCTIRRITTNTPLQALVTLNDEVYIEAAQALARRAVREAGASTVDQIRHALQLALIRPPLDREVRALSALYDRQLARYRENPEDARLLATDPLGPLPDGWNPAELAALTAVCNTILNLDEFLTRG